MENENMSEEEKKAFFADNKEKEEIRKEKAEQKAAQAKQKGIVKEILSWVEVILVSLALAWFIGTFIIMNAYIPSGSMENTLKEGDKVIGNRLAYKFSEPERGDIIMFKFPDDESRDFIKRVIGLPGETVTVKAGKVYINDSEVPLTEDYLKEEPFEADFGPYEVPAGHYFVMGDNRNGSNDSRYWNNPYVSEDEILAKAVIRWMPKVTILK